MENNTQEFPCTMVLDVRDGYVKTCTLHIPVGSPIGELKYDVKINDSVMELKKVKWNENKV